MFFLSSFMQVINKCIICVKDMDGRCGLQNNIDSIEIGNVFPAFIIIISGLIIAAILGVSESIIFSMKNKSQRMIIYSNDMETNHANNDNKAVENEIDQENIDNTGSMEECNCKQHKDIMKEMEELKKKLAYQILVLKEFQQI